MQEVSIRDLSLDQDIDAIRAIDTSFVTDMIYHIDCSGESFALVARPVSPPIRKQFSVDSLELKPRDTDWYGSYAAMYGRSSLVSLPCGLNLGTSG